MVPKRFGERGCGVLLDHEQSQYVATEIRIPKGRIKSLNKSVNSARTVDGSLSLTTTNEGS